ncbi:hypothetical protein [Streptomyces capoamus]|uniref:hypothetical protein n=1 Tax=Streptomyces capoamus TaxID=68183 RepID=UPI003398059A
MAENGSSDGAQNKFVVVIVAQGAIILGLLAAFLFDRLGGSLTAVATAGGSTLVASFSLGVTGARAAGYIRNTSLE